MRSADEFDLDLEGDLLRHEQPAGFEDHVPGETPVLAVDPSAGAEHGAVVAPRIGGVTQVVHRQCDGTGDALDGEVAMHPPGRALDLDTDGTVGRRRVVLDVEEVARAEVVIAADVAGVDRRHINHDLDGRVRRVGAYDHRAGDAGEATADLGEAEVAADEAELDLRR